MRTTSTEQRSAVRKGTDAVAPSSSEEGFGDTVSGDAGENVQDVHIDIEVEVDAEGQLDIDVSKLE